MRVYSPSQTATWMECPVMRALSKEGWQPKFVNTGHLAAIAGRSLAAGLGVYNNYRKALEAQGVPLSSNSQLLDNVIGTGDTILKMGMQEFEKTGLSLNQTATDYLRTMDKRVENSLRWYVTHDPIPPTWRIVDVEKDFGPDFGNARADLIVRDDEGRISPLDYKSVTEYNARFWASNMEKYQRSHQMFHYDWCVRETYKEPVTRHYIVSIVTQPVRLEVHTYPVDDEQISLWEQATRSAWATMEREDEGLQAPWMAAKHESNFGPCIYRYACFTAKFEPVLMAQQYINVKEIDERTLQP